MRVGRFDYELATDSRLWSGLAAGAMSLATLSIHHPALGETL